MDFDVQGWLRDPRKFLLYLHDSLEQVSHQNGPYLVPLENHPPSDNVHVCQTDWPFFTTLLTGKLVSPNRITASPNPKLNQWPNLQLTMSMLPEKKS